MRLPILLTLGAGLLMGCATTEPLPTYFILSRGNPAKSAHLSSPVRVYVPRVEVPAYLLRRNLATFQGEEIRYAPAALWALPLDQTIAIGVAANLTRIGVPAIGFQPAEPPPTHQYEVVIRITHFEGHENGDVILAGNWHVTTPDGKTVASRPVSIRRSGWQPGHYAELVALLSDGTAELSRRIAATLR
jgi:uncharacterized lipoprotein YmbA